MEIVFVIVTVLMHICQGTCQITMRQHSLALWWLRLDLSFFQFWLAAFQGRWIIWSSQSWIPLRMMQISFREKRKENKNKMKKILKACIYSIGLLYTHFNVCTVSMLEVSAWLFVYFPNCHIVLFPYGISLIWPITFPPVLLRSLFIVVVGFVW